MFLYQYNNLYLFYWDQTTLHFWVFSSILQDFFQMRNQYFLFFSESFSWINNPFSILKHFSVMHRRLWTSIDEILTDSKPFRSIACSKHFMIGVRVVSVPMASGLWTQKKCNCFSRVSHSEPLLRINICSIMKNDDSSDQIWRFWGNV